MFSSTAKEPMSRKASARARLEANGRDLDSTAHAAGKDVREFIETAVNSASEGISQAKEKISDTSDAITDRIREKPLSSAAIALGVGVLLGALFRRS